MTNIYVATSWRNTLQPKAVEELRKLGYNVYDFRNPEGGTGFAFGEVAADMTANGTYIDWNHESDNPHILEDVLNHPRCVAGFESDFAAMQAADIVVLLLPSERDAHLEIGWAVGAGKQTHIVLDNPCKASLMYRAVDYLHPNLADLLVTLGEDGYRV